MLCLETRSETGIKRLRRISIHTNSTATALKTDGVVRDVSRSQDAAFASLRDGASCDFLLCVSASVLVDDHGAVNDRFGSDSVGLENLLARIEERKGIRVFEPL